MNTDIFGSCVSRDGLEFVDGVTVGAYCARQSVVSSVAKPASEDTLSRLTIKPDTHAFHARAIEQDFAKTTLDRIDRGEGPLVIDFIEERCALAETTCGTLISWSQAAMAFSNARSLIKRLIKPYSDEHIELFEAAIGPFAERLSRRQVLLHRALYAPGDWPHLAANAVLRRFYDLTEAKLPHAVVINPPTTVRKPELDHKWGRGPYHYVDAYYRDFAERFARAVDGAGVRTDISMIKAEEAASA